MNSAEHRSKLSQFCNLGRSDSDVSAETTINCHFFPPAFLSALPFFFTVACLRRLPCRRLIARGSSDVCVTDEADGKGREDHTTQDSPIMFWSPSNIFLKQRPADLSLLLCSFSFLKIHFLYSSTPISQSPPVCPCIIYSMEASHAPLSGGSPPFLLGKHTHIHNKPFSPSQNFHFFPGTSKKSRNTSREIDGSPRPPLT